MADAVIIAGTRPGATSDQPGGYSRTAEVLRDIARGGIAGALAGIVVGGLGGRLLMRLAASLHPNASGAFTENGNRIGDITLGGTVGLVGFGMIFGLLAGALWVIVSPWIPGQSRIRAVLTAGLSMAIGTPLVIIGSNPDFAVLDHDPTVIALLIALVGLIGLSIPLIDGWLNRRLPHPVTSRTRQAAFYAVVSLMGALLVLPFVVLIFLTSDEYQLPLRAGYALFAVGLCTATYWALRVRGRASAPRSLVIAARGALVVATVLGVLTALPHVSRALGMPS